MGRLKFTCEGITSPGWVSKREATLYLKLRPCLCAGAESQAVKICRALVLWRFVGRPNVEWFLRRRDSIRSAANVVADVEEVKSGSRHTCFREMWAFVGKTSDVV